jgi:predicted dehydrogenase
VHVPAIAAALERGFSVLCDKPLAPDLNSARLLQELAVRPDTLVGLTYTYCGYGSVREARLRISRGDIGRVRKIHVRYTQGWLTEPVERQGNLQAAWRTDPAKAGPCGCMSDIGVHAQHLVEFVTGDRIAQLSADIASIVPGRILDDDGAVMFRMDNGARGVLIASQICAGDDNRLELDIYGETGGLHWAQEQPEQLELRWHDGRFERVRAAAGRTWGSRLPAGHPEGYIEAFANLYRAFAIRLAAHKRGVAPPADLTHVPGLQEGLRSLAFVDAVWQSSRASGTWQQVSSAPWNGSVAA